MGNMRDGRTVKFRNKAVMLLVLVLLGMSLAGCTAVMDNSNETSVGESSEGNKTVNVQKNDEIPVEKQTPEFLGAWKVTKMLDGTICAITEEDEKNIMGSEIACLKDYCDIAGSSIDNPDYRLEKLSLQEFRDGSKIGNDWGIDPNEKYIYKIGIYKGKEANQIWDYELGGYPVDLYYVDGHLIACIMNAFFELDKVTAHNGNKVNEYIVQEGQTIVGLTVKSITRSGASIEDITFSGEATVSGTYTWAEMDDGGEIACQFTLDEVSQQKVPVFSHVSNMTDLTLNDSEAVKKLLPKETGKATIVIGNYSIGERQVMTTADLISVSQSE